jgi:hypothetical protein
MAKLDMSPSPKEQQTLMMWAHNHPMAGHPGRDEMIRRVRQHRQWQGMNAWIMNYVKGCAVCQQNKIITHKACVPAYCIPTGDHTLPFQQVAMNLISGLPTCNKKNTILTIVDHECLRAAIFLPCTTTITGAGIAQLYSTWTMSITGLDSPPRSSVTGTPSSPPTLGAQ